MSRLDEAREILRAFGFDARRTNETAARTLLALAGIDEHTPWGAATNERMGVRAILDWMRGPLDQSFISLRRTGCSLWRPAPRTGPWTTSVIASSPVFSATARQDWSMCRASLTDQ